MIIKRRLFSAKKDDREIVPKDLVEKAKKDGVIQEYDGYWRIISLKANPPRFWDIKEDSKAKCEKILKAYQANRH